MAEVARARPRRRIDARLWSFLLSYISHWRAEEGTPSASELGESSSTTTPRVLPITGEPVHHTVPLLAARLVRHENRIDAVQNFIDDVLLGRFESIEEAVENLMIG